MGRIKEYVRHHRPIVVLMGIILALTTIPAIQTYFVVGDAWRGIIPPYSDTIYLARVHTIGEGHLTMGNSYFLEHSDGLPLTIFGGAWLNAIPLFMGASFVVTMAINFVLWSLLFAAAAYWLFRELRVAAWGAVLGTVFLYVQSYMHVWRPVNLQTVYPFYFLFYVALLLLIREQSRKNIMILALATGATFYFYSYLWQTIVYTFGVLILYALVRKNWSLLRASFLASCIGGVIGLPVLLYALWLSLTSPYFWESAGRLGLVNTHLPMAEVLYSGGWIGVMCLFLVVLLWRARALRENGEFIQLSSFIAIGGFGLWIMEGSNLITGKLLETGEHMPGFIFPWIWFSAFALGMFLWRQRLQLSGELRVLSVGVLLVLSVISVRFVFLDAFLPPYVNRATWQAEQQYAGPFSWLQDEEKETVVVWSDPHDEPSTLLSVYTRHFTLDSVWGMFELVPEGEIRERYLVSQYFNNPTVANLRTTDEMSFYVGRHDLPHQAKTIERGIKICRILFFWDKNKDCGTPPTPQDLLGEKFFLDLEKKFRTDIKPNIKAYLQKYHVSYILKDKVLNPLYKPETLGAVQVYADDRFELYKMQY